MKQPKHSPKLNGKVVHATRNDGKDEMTGVYHTEKNPNTFTVNDSGAALCMLRANWTIEDIVETEE